jgi:hypothetical protein
MPVAVGQEIVLLALPIMGEPLNGLYRLHE